MHMLKIGFNERMGIGNPTKCYEFPLLTSSDWWAMIDINVEHSGGKQSRLLKWKSSSITA